MRVQRARTKQLRAPLTTMLGHPKCMQCNFNSCSFNYKSDYSLGGGAIVFKSRIFKRLISVSAMDRPWIDRLNKLYINVPMFLCII